MDVVSKEAARSCVLQQISKNVSLKNWFDEISRRCENIEEALDKLVPADMFYRELGGLSGYMATIKSLLQNPMQIEKAIYHSPSFIDISCLDAMTEEAIACGIEALPEMAEMYPLGGAADRLHLVDESTGLELPAAKLQFIGKTLFELLIRDLQAREFLYFKKYGKQIVTPVAMMVSWEKDNCRHIEELMSNAQWFGRPQESFRFFVQPLVPVVNEYGEFLFSSSLQPVLKPGGHGVIWKLARDEGIFSWFETLGRKKILVRQINNPIAGLDYGLLAFMGIGWKRDMKFGFASCPRLLQAAEGVNVVIERKQEDRATVVLTNVEYCDFTKFGIEDLPQKKGDLYSCFSSNTNILFADLSAVREAVDQSPFPGLLLNLKKGLLLDEKGGKKEMLMGRLESTMQNIADAFVEEKGVSNATRNTFVTYNQRQKTISTTKKAFVSGGSLQETPENCFYDLLCAARELLEKHCQMKLPEKRSLEAYHALGPDCVFLYHPALGPLYSMIQQKIRGGSLATGSELNLEIAEVDLFNLSLVGSLRISADQIMGHVDGQGILRYSNQIGRCILRNVTVNNCGVDWKKSIPFWKGRFVRREGVEIILKGCSSLIAEDVVFEGSHRFVVEEGTQLRIQQKNGSIFQSIQPFVSE